MPGIDDTQKAFNSSVEDDIKNKISGDVSKGKEPKEPENSGDESDGKSGNDPAKTPDQKKNVDNNSKKPDNNSDDLSNLSESDLFDATVSKIITEEFDGDESKRDAAKGIANLAIKTFSGDPLKAAKSYKSLFDQTHQMKSIVKKNPFIEKLVNEASQGKQIDENYIKEMLGTATSNADQPTTKNTSQNVDKLDPADIDDFDPDKFTVEEMVESGSLDKDKYESASSIDKRDMLEKAKLRHGYKILPAKMAEKSVTLAQKKSQEKTRQEQISSAKEANKERLRNSQREFITKFDVDFDGNPEHAELFEEIYNKAVRLPDIDDDSGMLIADDAFERAAQHVFKQKGLNLQKADIPDNNDPDQKTKDPIERVTSNSADIMRRILSGTNGFSGKASKRQQQEQRQEQSSGNDFNSQVNSRVNDALNRNYQNTKMISGIRKTDRTKS